MVRTFFALAALALFVPSLAAPTGRCGSSFGSHRPGRLTAVSSASPTVTPTQPTVPIVEPEVPSSTIIPTSTSPQPTPSAVPGVEPPVAAPSTDKDKYLKSHNDFRALYGANALTWSDSLQASAQAVANKCQWVHSGAGENFSAGTGNVTPEGAVKLWLNEASKYNAVDPLNSGALHFTQVIWKATTQLGCATAKCTSGLPIGGANDPATFTVCHYNPVGNVVGSFDKNVGTRI